MSTPPQQNGGDKPPPPETPGWTKAIWKSVETATKALVGSSTKPTTDSNTFNPSRNGSHSRTRTTTFNLHGPREDNSTTASSSTRVTATNGPVDLISGTPYPTQQATPPNGHAADATMAVAGNIFSPQAGDTTFATTTTMATTTTTTPATKERSPWKSTEPTRFAIGQHPKPTPYSATKGRANRSSLGTPKPLPMSSKKKRAYRPARHMRRTPDVERISSTLAGKKSCFQPSAKRQRHEQDYEPPVTAKKRPGYRNTSRLLQGTTTQQDDAQDGHRSKRQRRTRIGFDDDGTDDDDDLPSEHFVSTPAPARATNRNGTPYPGRSEENDREVPLSERKKYKAKRSGTPEEFPVMPNMSLIVDENGGIFSSESEREDLGEPIAGKYKVPYVISDDIPQPDGNYNGRPMEFFKQDPLPEIKRKSYADQEDDEAMGPDSTRMKKAPKWTCEKCNAQNEDDESACTNCGQYRTAKSTESLGWGGLGLFDGFDKKWQCISCDLLQDPKDEKCLSCGTAKPTPEQTAAYELKKAETKRKTEAAMSMNPEERAKLLKEKEAESAAAQAAAEAKAKAEKAANAKEAAARIQNAFGGGSSQSGGSTNFGSTAFSGAAATLTSPAPGGSSQGFSFGGQATATTGGFSFGSPPPASTSTVAAPAPASSGFTFGNSSPAPAPSASASVPVGGFSFGGASAPAPSNSTAPSSTSTPAASSTPAVAAFAESTAKSSEGKPTFATPSLPFNPSPGTSVPPPGSSSKRKKEDESAKPQAGAPSMAPFPSLTSTSTNSSVPFSFGGANATTSTTSSGAALGSIPSSDGGGDSQRKKRRSRDDRDGNSGESANNASSPAPSSFGSTTGGLFGSGNLAGGAESTPALLFGGTSSTNTNNGTDAKVENSGDSANKPFVFGADAKKADSSAPSMTNGAASKPVFSFAGGSTGGSTSNSFGQGSAPAPAPVPASESNLFGSSTPAPPALNPTTSSTFGSAPGGMPNFAAGANALPSAPQFGTSNNSGPTFGGPSATSTANAPSFGTNAPFGSTPAPAPAPATSFGSTPAPVAAASTGFGSAPAPAGSFGAQGAPVFGNSAPAAAPAMPFGNTGQSAAPAPFGGGFGSTAQAPVPFGSAPAPFGQPAANASGGFGQPPANASASGGGFGQSTGGFGQPPAVPQQQQSGGFGSGFNGGAPSGGGGFSMGSSGPPGARRRRIVKAKRPGGSRPA